MSKKGFTLVELLVVISIIGILSVIGITIFSSTQASARDAKRKADLHAIYTALEIYYSKNGRYPEVSSTCTTQGGIVCNTYVYSTAGNNWIPQLVSDGEMAQVPVDPKNNANGPWDLSNNNYSYAYGNVGPTGQYYDLTARLENTLDPARCGVKDYKWRCDNQHWCQAYGGSYTNQIYELSPPGPGTCW